MLSIYTVYTHYLFLKHSFQRADGVASWYTVCGQPHANYQNWLSGLLVLCGTGGYCSTSVGVLCQELN